MWIDDDHGKASSLHHACQIGFPIRCIMNIIGKKDGSKLFFIYGIVVDDDFKTKQ